MDKALYDDGVYMVTPAIVSTPRRFYPLAHTTASIRRDPLWAAISFTILGGACLAIYGDLLQFQERVTLVVICVGALLAGGSVTILRISAIGHSGAMIIGRSSRIRALYRAIRDARTTHQVRLETY
ncbi:MAG: hypothetical protein WC807_20140 [Hyphomicrobium sp.]|jgi:hypothetical protein